MRRVLAGDRPVDALRPGDPSIRLLAQVVAEQAIEARREELRALLLEASGATVLGVAKVFETMGFPIEVKDG